MGNPRHLWYRLKPYSVSSDEKYDSKKDEDLLMLCENIPDLLFQIFMTPNQHTTISLRVPIQYKDNLDAIESFETNMSPMNTTDIKHGSTAHVMKLQRFSTLRLASKSAYPLMHDRQDMHANIFSTFSKIPYGVFGLKLLHAKSDIISKQYDLVKKKNKRSYDKETATDPYERHAKQKSECSVFFHCEMFYGVQTAGDETHFENSIPYFSKTRKPNSLLNAKTVTSSKSNPEKAYDFYKKFVFSAAKKRPMILSNMDIMPFVRFPENPNSIGLDSGQASTMSNSSVSENAFDDFTGDFK